MNDLLLSRTLTHLKALVAFDTQNPPRRIGTGGIFDYLQAQLAGFTCTLTDHGFTNGASYTFAFSDSSFDGVEAVTVVDANTFTLAVTNAGA